MLTWRERDAELIRLATRHVCRTRHFFRYFTSPQAAYRRAEKLRRQGQLRLVATIVIGDAGRPENVYCNSYKPKYDQLRHELLLTDFLLCYPEADTLRGWAVNRRVRPDAQITLADYFYYIELDTGEQSHAQVRRRQARYAGVEDFVLYVTLSPRRLEGLRRHAHEAVRSIALFTTLDEVQRDPHGPVWIDVHGERTAI
jgi:hypothetical protein